MDESVMNSAGCPQSLCVCVCACVSPVFRSFWLNGLTLCQMLSDSAVPLHSPPNAASFFGPASFSNISTSFISQLLVCEVFSQYLSNTRRNCALCWHVKVSFFSQFDCGRWRLWRTVLLTGSISATTHEQIKTDHAESMRYPAVLRSGSRHNSSMADLCS